MVTTSFECSPSSGYLKEVRICVVDDISIYFVIFVITFIDSKNSPKVL